MIRVAIIGFDDSIKERIIPLFDNRKIRIIYIAWQKIDLNLFKLIDCLYIDDKLDRNYKEEIFYYCISKGIKLWIFPSIIMLAGKNCYKNRGNILACQLTDFKLNLMQKFIKRMFDLIFSLIAIILLFPLMIIIFSLIKINDSGPAIYRQKRLTANHKEFILYKFRTMIHNAEKVSGATLSSINDHRITKIGKFLRKSHLDELPQIFNVLIGNMSVVGPRPERKCFVIEYERQNMYYRYRYFVKAGITGLSQINCRYNADFSDKLSFDLLYISRYRFIQDIIIILKTINVFFDDKAAEGVGGNFDEKIKSKGLLVKMIKPGLMELRDDNEKNRTEL
ncbi:MAG: sugar transferase [Bacilli bacterium]|nr:sugar transferase [Bacilli bacterium]